MKQKQTIPRSIPAAQDVIDANHLKINFFKRQAIVVYGLFSVAEAWLPHFPGLALAN